MVQKERYLNVGLSVFNSGDLEEVDGKKVYHTSVDKLNNMYLNINSLNKLEDEFVEINLNFGSAVLINSFTGDTLSVLEYNKPFKFYPTRSDYYLIFKEAGSYHFDFKYFSEGGNFVKDGFSVEVKDYLSNPVFSGVKDLHPLTYNISTYSVDLEGDSDFYWEVEDVDSVYLSGFGDEYGSPSFYSYGDHNEKLSLVFYNNSSYKIKVWRTLDGESSKFSELIINPLDRDYVNLNLLYEGAMDFAGSEGVLMKDIESSGISANSVDFLSNNFINSDLVVDKVKVEFWSNFIRTSADFVREGALLVTGEVVELDGTPFYCNDLNKSSLYKVIVKERNHLPYFCGDFVHSDFGGISIWGASGSSELYSGLENTYNVGISPDNVVLLGIKGGDINGDGKINSRDMYLLNGKNYVVIDYSSGLYDINRDGKVDNTDLQIVNKNKGSIFKKK